LQAGEKRERICHRVKDIWQMPWQIENMVLDRWDLRFKPSRKECDARRNSSPGLQPVVIATSNAFASIAATVMRYSCCRQTAQPPRMFDSRISLVQSGLALNKEVTTAEQLAEVFQH
jgi:hypothetical protein